MSSPTHARRASIPSPRTVSITQDVSYVMGFIAAAAVLTAICLRSVVGQGAEGSIALTTMTPAQLWIAFGISGLAGILVGGATLTLVTLTQMMLGTDRD